MNTNTQPSSLHRNDTAPIYANPRSTDYMPLHPSTRSWEIGRGQVDVIKVIGKGAFSEVAKATVWNLRGNQEYTTVAAKMLKGVKLLLFLVLFSFYFINSLFI